MKGFKTFVCFIDLKRCVLKIIESFKIQFMLVYIWLEKGMFRGCDIPFHFITIFTLFLGKRSERLI
jgi:hypothetical protein